MEDLTLGATYYVGDTFTSSDVDVNVERFQWSNGTWTSSGYAQVDDAGLAGGTGQDVQVNNVNLNFGFGCILLKLSLLFGEYGGNLNININGDFRNFNNFADINGIAIGGVNVSVVNGNGNDTGRLTLTGIIKSFAVGGQELWLDDICSTGECCIDLVSKDSLMTQDLRQFRDELLTQNELGKNLTQIYYQHSPEVTDILLRNPMLSIRSAALLKQVMHGINFLMGEKNGRDMVMNRLLVQRIQKLFADISEQGSDELGETLSELSEMLEEYKGMRFSRIWHSLEHKKINAAPSRLPKRNLTATWGALKGSAEDK
jgi:hypothetical protein